MLTGFNTDIKYAERVYHVQTEDRGLENPVVESLVYVGGEILLSKKSPYVQHVHGDKVDEKAVRELMDVQHRRIIEAIRRGRLDSKKPEEGAFDLGDEAAPSPTAVSAAAVAAVAAILSVPSEPLPGDARPAAARPRTPEKPGAATKPARPASTAASRAAERRPPPSTEGEFVETEVTPRPLPALPSSAAATPPPRASLSETAPPFPSAIQPAVRLPAPAPPAAAAAPAAPEPGPRKPPGSTSGPKTLDQVIIDYLASEAASERLDLSIMAGGEFLSGETVALTVITTTSLGHKPVPGAQITVRVVSTAGPSQVLFRGVTGNDGMVKTSCALPDIGSGSAALVVAAFSAMGTSEAKYLIGKRPR